MGTYRVELSVPRPCAVLESPPPPRMLGSLSDKEAVEAINAPSSTIESSAETCSGCCSDMVVERRQEELWKGLCEEDRPDENRCARRVWQDEDAAPCQRWVGG